MAVGALALQGDLPVRVVPDAALQAQQDASAAANVRAQQQQAQAPQLQGLAAYIRTKFDYFKRHRNMPNAGWTERLLAALRTFNGQYDAGKLAEIRQFGGSEVYAKVTAMKCRGASALLRDVYLGTDRAWGIDPPSDPKIPDHIMESVAQLVQAEIHAMGQSGQPVDPNDIRDRAAHLVEQARQATKKKAADQAKIAEDKIDEMLHEGGFYQALAEFIVDLPIFPFAVIKGPTVRIMPVVDWTTGSAIAVQKPRLCWNRVSPFDIWWTPGCADIMTSDIIERSRVTRAELNDLLDLPGYNQAEVRAVLQEYGTGGLNDNWDMSDAERAVQESRENPWLNQSGLINCLEWNGNIQGLMLLNYGVDPDLIQDPVRDYMVQCWLIGTHVIKVQMSPSPRKRHPYYITSYEKVPGTPIGNALTDTLSDVQDVSNAAIRALVNNMSIASGPQVVINDDRLAADEDGEAMYPWKRWHLQADPMANNTQEPISFFQPTSNAGEILQIYQALSGLADDLSGIPRYLNGQSPGGAGRTSSGLAMLMGNASKILQMVAANIDRDIFQESLTYLFDLIMLTDTSGLLTGEENVRVMGVTVALQRETQRSRQLEFLQISANPVDMQIVGIPGRAAVLRSVASTIGLDGETIVPDDDKIQQMVQQQQAAQAAAPQQALMAVVEKGVQAGVQAGVQRISTELTAGILAQAAHMAEGPPAHVGTPPGAAPPIAQAAAQAQGNQSGPSSTADMGPRANLNQASPAPVAGGVH